MSKIIEPQEEETKKMSKSKENLELKELDFDENGLSVINGVDLSKDKFISTGSLGLDILTNGQPKGVIQAWGPDGIGKSTLLLIMGGEFQKAHDYKNVRVMWHAVEGRYNEGLIKMAPALKMVTSDPKNDVDGNGKPANIFKVTLPKNGELLCDYILRTLKQDKIKFFHIIDSIDGLESIVNADKSMADNEKTASTATLMTKFLKKASSYANHYGHVIACTQQVRDKISSAPTHVSGVGKQMAGGHALSHYSNLRMAFEKLWTDLYIFENSSDTKSKIIGHVMSIKLEKVSTSGNVHSKAIIPFIYNHGVDLVREVSTLALAFGLITKTGNTYSYGEEKLGVGERKFIQSLKENPKLVAALEKEIRNLAGI